MFIINKNYIKQNKKMFKLGEIRFFSSSNKKKIRKAHPFHILPTSPLPFITAWSVFCMAIGAVSTFHNWGFNWALKLGVFTLVTCLFKWAFNIFHEADSGYHTEAVQRGLKFGFILFIASEVMFFVSFFWAFFHASLAPSAFIGGVWPPVGIKCFSPLSIPLLNTLILLTSGVTITRCHILIMTGNWRLSNCLMDTTIILGILFLLLQYSEYVVAPFSISDGIYGSVFFLLTGFHGFHVFVGTIFLILSKLRMYFKKIYIDDHTSFEVSSWYWHFVDVVWIFVYFFVYIWAGRYV